ncbi:MAG: hypothetical protein E7574_05735 [Ruminococcaceae bacterium]|nr:hypothetical protein [Oscillospiraceae bacterium]
MECITYYLRCEKYLTDNGEYCISYGIAAGTFEDGVLCVMDSASNVSPDRIQVERLVDLFNSQNLSLTHFRDVLDDMLNFYIY